MAVHKNSSIDNEYAYMLDSSILELNCIHKIIEKYYIKSTIKNEKYIGNVTDEPYLETIQKKFPFLSDSFSIFTLNTDMKIHVDTHRKACINFIYPNGSKSYTKLYNVVTENPLIEHIPEYRINLYKEEDLLEVFKFELNSTALFNTNIPHTVNLVNNIQRITLSWPITQEYDFEYCKGKIKEYEKL